METGHAKPVRKKSTLDDTQPFGTTPPSSRETTPRLVWITIAFLILAVSTYILFFRNRPVRTRLEAQLIISEIAALEAENRLQQVPALTWFDQWKQQSGSIWAEWEIILQSQAQRKEISRSARRGDENARLLQEGLRTLDLLLHRTQKLERKLGNPHTVVAGDTHYKIAEKFLKAKSPLTDDEIGRLLDSTPLKEPLLPGFKVWNFYFPDGFATFVTRGYAPLTPEEAQQREQQKQKGKTAEAMKQLYTLHFLVGETKSLLSRGILNGGMFDEPRIGEVKLAQFSASIDLRQQQQIRIQARSLKLDRISTVTIHPQEFKEGSDYRLVIARNGRSALLSFRNILKFRGRRLVIAVK